MIGDATLLWATPFRHGPDRVRDLARELLAESPFREQQPSAVEQLLERAGIALGEVLSRVLAAVSGDTIVAWVIVTSGAILLLVAVWRWTRGLRIGGGVDPEVGDLQGRTSQDWRNLSDEAIGHGALDRALRLRYLAVVAALVERAVVQDVPGRTIRELDAELATMRPDVAADVAAAGARLERVTYGGFAASQGDIDAVDAALRAVSDRRAVAT